MPFTFSHPALILPLTYLPKKWYSLTGLIIGSLIPDFEYFIRMRIMSIYSHTLEGLFWFDLPLALLIAFIYHGIVRNELLKSLPVFLRSRLSVFSHFDWNLYFKEYWFVVIVSVLIGAASHLLWDSFTHDHGYFVHVFPELSNKVLLLNEEILILKILQHSSTLFGGIVIAIVVYKLPISRLEESETSWKYWLLFISITFLIVSIRLMAVPELHQIGNVIVTLISASLISLILSPILLRISFISKT